MKSLKPLSDKALVRGSDYNRLLELIMANRVQVNGTGLSLQRTASGVYLSTATSRLAGTGGYTGGDGPAGSYSIIVGKIKQVAEYVDNIWNYRFVQMVKSAQPGYETGSWHEYWDETQACYNLLEYANSGVGVQMNGVDIENLTGTFALQPCPVGALVMVYVTRLSGSNVPEYWFQYPSGVDGEC